MDRRTESGGQESPGQKCQFRKLHQSRGGAFNRTRLQQTTDAHGPSPASCGLSLMRESGISFPDGSIMLLEKIFQSNCTRTEKQARERQTIIEKVQVITRLTLYLSPER